MPTQSRAPLLGDAYPHAIARLVIGPLLRHVGRDDATVWVRTDAPCEVDVLGRRAPTFSVEGHHFALVTIEGLDGPTPYEVLLDGAPTGAVGRIRPVPAEGPVRLAFGSCRRSAPHHAPYTLRPEQDPRGCEWDALRALALRVERGERPPDLFLHLGDQVYADDVDPSTEAFIATRRDTTVGPGEQVADFVEYCELYRVSWSEPVIARFMASVPNAMIFDDHDVHDDWNTSRAWVRRMRATGWWDERIVSAFASYWVHQHIGNFAPADLEGVPMWDLARQGGDITDALRAFAFAADREIEGTRWSFHRDLGRTRLIVMDSRAGRVLEPASRRMVDDDEWSWIQEASRGDYDHVLYGTTLPVMLSSGLHMLEGWNEAVSEGAWGRGLARVGERIREAVDLEHWSAFGSSFRLVEELLLHVAQGGTGARPASVGVLSGDVHHAYVAQADFDGAGDHSPVWQAVCSPIRNPLSAREKRVIRASMTKLAGVAGRALARTAGVRPSRMSWSMLGGGPSFDNQVATIDIDGRRCTVRIEKAVGEKLDEVFERTLAGPC